MSSGTAGCQFSGRAFAHRQLSNYLYLLMANKILITGGAGFIGSHLAERLGKDNEVSLLDSFRRDSLKLAPHLRSMPNISVVRADVGDPKSLEGVCAGFDVVVHMAAIAGVSSYYTEPLLTLKTNILGTVNLLEEVVRASVEQFVYFSTSEVYGSEALGVSETHPLTIGSVTDRRWVYSTSKIAGENFSVRFAEQYGFSCSVVRPFNVYGPRQVGEGAISNFCRAAAAKAPLKVYGEGTAVRAWCYVSDMVDAVESIIATKAAAGRVFNIGNPDAVETTSGLAERIARLSPGTTIERQADQHSEVKERSPVIDTARDILGYTPKIGLDEGLRRTFEWFLESNADR
jgi:nucleoside-diphosphate-sugar epimerase